jgi:phage replication-related protein YjqB (UPF0714/DUF867 family)
VWQPDDLKQHVPSVLADPDGAPQLAAFLDHVEIVVSVHGYWSRRDQLGHAVLVGGGSRHLVTRMAQRLRRALPDSPVVDDSAAIPRELRGLDPRNPVNRSTRGGVQLELPPRLRVIGPMASRPEAAAHRGPTNALVGALAAYALEASAIDVEP